MLIVDQVRKIELLFPRAWLEYRFEIFFCGVNRDGPYTAKVLILVFFTICLLFLGTVSKQLYKYNVLIDGYMVQWQSGQWC